MPIITYISQAGIGRSYFIKWVFAFDYPDLAQVGQHFLGFSKAALPNALLQRKVRLFQNRISGVNHMLKHLHLLFVALVIITFFGRVYLAQIKSELLENKWLKIAPHALAGLLLLTGFGLVFEGNWLDGQYGWIVAKLFLMFAFIGLGILTLKSEGEKRWYALAGSIFCLVYIVKVAFTKQIFWFF
jgi:uncharacterized membrane protein SirB2